LAMQDHNQALEIFTALEDNDENLNRNKLAEILLHRAETYTATDEYTKCLQDCDRALKIREELKTADRLPDDNDLSKVLLIRGRTHQNLNQPKEALNDFKASAAILETIPAERRFEKIEHINELINNIEKDR